MLNDNFELYLTPPSPDKTEKENRNRNTIKGLHIADASVISALTPGGPTATVMEMGMYVAKRSCGETPPGVPSWVCGLGLGLAALGWRL